MRQNLWGDFDEMELVTSPKTHLREQARLLSDITSGYLEGEVEIAERRDEQIEVQLLIVAPLLNDYRYTVLVAKYSPAAVYPAELIDTTSNEAHDCATESEFVDVLGKVLSSPGVRKVVSSLVSQSKEEDEGIPF